MPDKAERRDQSELVASKLLSSLRHRHGTNANVKAQLLITPEEIQDFGEQLGKFMKTGRLDPKLEQSLNTFTNDTSQMIHQLRNCTALEVKRLLETHDRKFRTFYATLTEHIEKPVKTNAAIETVKALCRDFPEVYGVTIGKGGIYVVAVTTPVILRSVHLNDFAIAMGTNTRDTDLLTIALHPKYPRGEANSHLPHPHIYYDSPCLGPASGRVGDYIRRHMFWEAALLVNSVLHTYGSHSPYRSLEAWGGGACACCRSEATEGNIRCSVSRCGSSICAKCRPKRTCEKCKRVICPDHSTLKISKGICTKCKKAQEKK